MFKEATSQRIWYTLENIKKMQITLKYQEEEVKTVTLPQLETFFDNLSKKNKYETTMSIKMGMKYFTQLRGTNYEVSLKLIFYKIGTETQSTMCSSL